ncbi:MAG TPA: hypothetical protein VI589_08440, partial [Vicinamibacteria bacterium]
MRRRPLALGAGGASALVLSLSALVAAETAPVRAQRVQEAVSRLASDEWQGRRAGTEGALRAAEWIASEMRAAGLEPGAPDGTFFQSFSFIDGVEV